MNVPENIKSKLRIEIGFAAIRIAQALTTSNVSQAARPMALVVALHAELAECGWPLSQVLSAVASLEGLTEAELQEAMSRASVSTPARDDETAAYAMGEAMAAVAASEPPKTPEELLSEKDA